MGMRHVAEWEGSVGQGKSAGAGLLRSVASGAKAPSFLEPLFHGLKGRGFYRRLAARGMMCIRSETEDVHETERVREAKDMDLIAR